MKETNIAQLSIYKGEKIANAGYLENVADFCESLNVLNFVAFLGFPWIMAIVLARYTVIFKLKVQ